MTKTMDIKSLLIGFLLATSVMLFMGHTVFRNDGAFQGPHTTEEVYHKLEDLEKSIKLLVERAYQRRSWN